MTQIELPPGFLFGAATSAYQIEGGWDADGKGLSIWDRFTHQKGHIHKGQNGDTAADTYRDFQTDIDIMREMGLDVYGFPFPGRALCRKAAVASTRRDWITTSGW